MFDVNNLKNRYDLGWVTDAQLERYVDLGVITRAQARQITGTGNEKV